MAASCSFAVDTHSLETASAASAGPSWLPGYWFTTGFDHATS
jgi:hypothetical protein